jgi:hypothetical protein
LRFYCAVRAADHTYTAAVALTPVVTDFTGTDSTPVVSTEGFTATDFAAGSTAAA